MEVCHLITSLRLGGSQKLILQIVKNSKSENLSHTVCSIGPQIVGGENELRSKFEDAGARVVDFGAKYRSDPFALWKIFQFFKQENPDVLHAHSVDANLVSRVIGRVAGIDAVVSTHHIVPTQYHPALRALDAVTTPLDSITVGVSDGVRDEFVGNRRSWFPSFPDQWETVYNGIEIEKFRSAVETADVDSVRQRWGIDPDDFVYLTVGRYVPEKVQGDIIKATAEIKERHPEFCPKLLIVGSGDLQTRLENIVNDHGISESVTVTGYVDEVHPYYAMADVFVSASIREGLPMVHIEAMSAGLPIVATDIPGVREIVFKGETGLLVPTKSPTKLAQAMTELEATDRRERFGRRGFERANKVFNINRTVRSYIDIYKHISS